MVPQLKKKSKCLANHPNILSVCATTEYSNHIPGSFQITTYSK